MLSRSQNAGVCELFPPLLLPPPMPSVRYAIDVASNPPNLRTQEATLMGHPETLPLLMTCATPCIELVRFA